MLRELNALSPPRKLLDYFKQNSASRPRCRRRAVLVRPVERNWQLVCCVVEAVPKSTKELPAVKTHRYENFILFEDWFEPKKDFQRLVNDVQVGRLAFDDIVIERKGPAVWQSEFAAVPNGYMERAGFFARTKFEEAAAEIPLGYLNAPGLNFYPDFENAAADWLPLSEYHGTSDARNQHVIFLLPETRAYFRAVHFKGGVLGVRVDGAKSLNPGLAVKGMARTGK